MRDIDTTNMDDGFMTAGFDQAMDFENPLLEPITSRLDRMLGLMQDQTFLLSQILIAMEPEGDTEEDEDEQPTTKKYGGLAD